MNTLLALAIIVTVCGAIWFVACSIGLIIRICSPVEDDADWEKWDE